MSKFMYLPKLIVWVSIALIVLYILGYRADSFYLTEGMTQRHTIISWITAMILVALIIFVFTKLFTGGNKN